MKSVKFSTTTTNLNQRNIMEKILFFITNNLTVIIAFSIILVTILFLVIRFTINCPKFQFRDFSGKILFLDRMGNWHHSNKFGNHANDHHQLQELRIDLRPRTSDSFLGGDLPKKPGFYHIETVETRAGTAIFFQKMKCRATDDVYGFNFKFIFTPSTTSPTG